MGSRPLILFVVVVDSESLLWWNVCFRHCISLVVCAFLLILSVSSFIFVHVSRCLGGCQQPPIDFCSFARVLFCLICGGDPFRLFSKPCRYLSASVDLGKFSVRLLAVICAVVLGTPARTLCAFDIAGFIFSWKFALSRELHREVSKDQYLLPFNL